MSKFITSVFLIAAMLVSGLSPLTSSIPASATLANPIDCSFAGMYKNRTETGSPCRPCPVDFVCKLIINSKGDRVSPEKPGKNGVIDSEVVPCPAGTSTKGYTLHPALGTLLTKDQDNFQVGTMATDPSMCKKPDFKCPTESPILVQDATGELKCFANCPTNQAAIIFEGIQTCGIKCRDDELVQNKKCFKQCAANEVLSSKIGQDPKCVSVCIASSIQGQIPNEAGSCVCPPGKSVILDSLNSNTGKCGVPVPCPIEGQIKSGEGVCFCEPPRTLSSDKKSCDLPVEPCGRNTYGTNKPNCKPCPDGARSLIGQAITMDDCVFDPCSIAGQTRLAGKCVCAAGKVVNADQTICVTPEVPCTVKGQVKNYYGTCECPFGQVLNTESKSCELPAQPCGINTYGTFKPKCTPCPAGSRAAAGTAAVIEDCNYDPCSIVGQTRSEGKCTCPQGTQISKNGLFCEKPSEPCPAKGQIKTGDGECFCLYPAVLNIAKTVCEVPPAVCPINTFGEAQPKCTPCPKDSESAPGSKIVQDCVFDPCPAFGQVRKDNICGCVAPSLLNSTGRTCEIPSVPCKANQYGISEPNCKPCPANFTSIAGKAFVEKDCVGDKCTIPGQIRFYDGNCQCPDVIGYLIIAANNSKSCGFCPTDNTIAQAGKEPTGENIFKCVAPVVVAPVVPKVEDKPSGICGGGWVDYLCYAAGAYLIYDTFTCGGLVTVVQCDSQKPEIPNTGGDMIKPVYNPTNTGPKPRIVTEEWKTAANKCSDSNSNYVAQVIQDGKNSAPTGLGENSNRKGQWHQDNNGEYVWLKTSARGKIVTSYSTTILNTQNSGNAALTCLMAKYAAIKGVVFGSRGYVDALLADDILHGFNSNPKILAECLNLRKLLAVLNENLSSSSLQIRYKYSIYFNQQKVTQSYFSREEAIAEFKSKDPNRRSNYTTNNNTNLNFGIPSTPAEDIFNFGQIQNNNINYVPKSNTDLNFGIPSNPTDDIFNFGKIQNNSGLNVSFVEPNSDLTASLPSEQTNYELYPTGFLNLFDSLKVNAMDDMDDSNSHSSVDIVATNPEAPVDTSGVDLSDSNFQLAFARNISEEDLEGVEISDGSDQIAMNNLNNYNPQNNNTTFNPNNFENGVTDPNCNSNFNSCVSFASLDINGDTAFLVSKNESITNWNTFFESEYKIVGLDFSNDNSELAKTIGDKYVTDEEWAPFKNYLEYSFTNDKAITNNTTVSNDEWLPFQYFINNQNNQSTNKADTSYLDPNFGFPSPDKFKSNSNTNQTTTPNYSPDYSNSGKFDGSGETQYYNPCQANYGGYDKCNELTNENAIETFEKNASIGSNCVYDPTEGVYIKAGKKYVPGIEECNEGTDSKSPTYNGPFNQGSGNVASLPEGQQSPDNYYQDTNS